MDAETYIVEMDEIRAAIHRALAQAGWRDWRTSRTSTVPQRLAKVIPLRPTTNTAD